MTRGQWWRYSHLHLAWVQLMLLYRCLVPWWHIAWPKREAWTATWRRYGTHGWEMRMYARGALRYLLYGWPREGGDDAQPS